MKYLIDTNCFIGANNGFLPVSIATSFWNLVKNMAIEGKFTSIEYVLTEINAHTDDLRDWVNNNLSNSFFSETSADEIVSLGEVIEWASKNESFSEKAKRKFLRTDKADIHIVAKTKLNPNEYTVVSQEASAPSSPGEIKLPDACRNYGVRCITFREMLLEIGQTF